MPNCERCDRWYRTERALWQHQQNSPMHHICHQCNLDFASAWALTQHYVQSSVHPYCQRCGLLYNDWEDLYEHYEDQHYYCNDCNKLFDFEKGLHEHRRQKHADVYCVSCKRMFRDNNALRNHLKSKIHQEHNINCPMKDCDKSFISRAALVLHLESGTCRSRITRDMVNRIVAKLDQGGLITNPSRLIGDGGVTSMWATERAWNGATYECYLCHRSFRSLPALNQHLNSPAHEDKMYRCPRVLSGCGAEFRTLSGFCQHMESEQCGVHRFKTAMDPYIGDLANGRRLLGY